MNYKYNCIKCDFSTNNSGNWSIHLKTDKHKSVKDENPQIITCTLCDKIFKHNSSLIRHIKKCKKNSENTDILNKFNELKIKFAESENKRIEAEYEKKLAEAEKKLAEAEKKQIEQLAESEKKLIISESENKVNKQIAESEKKLATELLNRANNSEQVTHKTIEVAQSSLNALTFAQQNFGSAPPLRAIHDYSIINKFKEQLEIVEIVTHYHKHDELIKYLGDIIVNYYKKENPAEQSVWNTDTSRSNYLVRIDGATVIWVIDKKGLIFAERAVIPLLAYLEECAKKFIQDNVNYDHKDDALMPKRLGELETYSKFITDIKKSVIADGLVKYMGPGLYLKKLLKTKVATNTVVNIGNNTATNAVVNNAATNAVVNTVNNAVVNTVNNTVVNTANNVTNNLEDDISDDIVEDISNNVVNNVEDDIFENIA